MVKLNSQTKMLLYGVGTVFGLATAFFTYKLIKGNLMKKQANDNEVGGGNTNTNETSGETPDNNEYVSGTPKPSNDSFPITVTMQGVKVWLLQSALKELGQNIAVDGDMGVQTVEALADYGAYTWGTNAYCGKSYSCGLSKDEYNDLIKEAKEAGFDYDKAHNEAIKHWQK